MIHIILLFALMQLGINLLFKPKYNQLSCGLFGVAAENVEDIDINKVKILGIFNDSRGGHSCGLAIDGDIIVGVNQLKLFKDFIGSSRIENPYELPVILGHTRYATGGLHNEDNAHPFGFGINNDYYEFIGTHNGSLHNQADLAEEYKVSTSQEIINKYKVKSYRQKIDSEILLECIYTSKSFKVLEKYQGAAALVFYNTNEPDTVYLYHGKSKKYEYGVPVEERPLFYYQESDNIFYYSSIKESLEAIKNTSKCKVLEFEHNTVYKIKNGNVSKATKFLIDRSKASQINGSCAIKSTQWDNKKWDPVKRIWVEKSAPKQDNKTVLSTKGSTNTKTSVITTDTAETIRTNFAAHFRDYRRNMKAGDVDTVYFENLRYWKQYSLLTGIYVLNAELVPIFVCRYDCNFEEEYKKTNKVLNKLENIERPVKLYFVEGIQLLTLQDYNRILNNIRDFSTVQLSHCTVHPIKDLTHENSLVYFEGKLASLTFKPFTGKNLIKINNGKCVSIIPDNDSVFEEELFLLDNNLEIVNQVYTQIFKSKILEERSDKISDEDSIELYKENILATVEYCIDDCDVSLTDVATNNIAKTKFEKIKEFVSTTLKF